ncbi:flagellar basal body rod protein FlgC [Cellulomonas denverensis]|uniref:Flagellar basal-body rod protein FlgC n=1 Tax=Cellulomonas denverensis TaxID=264297 RepID=A0A7X6KV37_9CELL|nr:flagellar basal body rod C-terminal domain-containing protein [Cellulomonas denverensis]NKY22861.1 flagellar basal-body rod protein FlgC [Cellulomonas denverensis]GIG24067.1 flagellar basal-body rod protein FlgC [Cellulomonas denverensis]
MTTFGAIGIASTGMTVYRKWIDAVSDNLSNLNTVRATNEDAYQAKYVIASEISSQNGGGAQVAGIALGSAEGRMVYEPDNPLADEDGYVKYPDIDMASQMGQLIMAQRGYQANAAVVDRAKASYEAALQIGRNQ